MTRPLSVLGLLLLLACVPIAHAQQRVMEIVVLAEESGEPVAGARLSGRIGEEREARVTDADGRTEVVLPPEAVRVDLRLDAPGRVPVRAIWIAAEAAPGRCRRRPRPGCPRASKPAGG